MWNESTPGRIRTCDRRIRNPLLYPTELRGPMTSHGIKSFRARQALAAYRLSLPTQLSILSAIPAVAKLREPYEKPLSGRSG
jgi:hypothetical protein